ncbi:MAG: hypothetical protein LUC94_06600 [Clostridiales bacterium]|nr:hypothetical protein [Clostridiales bacterium]
MIRKSCGGQIHAVVATNLISHKAWKRTNGFAGASQRGSHRAGSDLAENRNLTTVERRGEPLPGDDPLPTDTSGAQRAQFGWNRGAIASPR